MMFHMDGVDINVLFLGAVTPLWFCWARYVLFKKVIMTQCRWFIEKAALSRSLKGLLCPGNNGTYCNANFKELIYILSSKT